MPTYDYECDACNHRFEEFQSMMDEPLKKCPKCKKSKLRRLLGTGAAIIFKGSGFYQTDYRSESYKSGAKSESAKSEAAKGEAAKGEESKASGTTKTNDAAAADGASDKGQSKPAGKKAK